MTGLIVLNIYAFILLLLISIIFFKKERQNKIEDKTYSYLLITSIGVLITGISLGIMVSSESINTLFIKIVNKAYLISILTWIFILTRYTIYISYSVEKYRKKNKLVNILYYISLFLVAIFNINVVKSKDLVKAEGLSVIFAYSSFLLMILIILKAVLFNYKKMNSKKYVPVYLLLFVLITLFLLMIYDPSLNYIVNPGLVLITIIMYHTIENPDLRIIEQLDRAKLAAEKANRAKSDFLSNMSHEIRTPLNAIVGFSDCILEETTLEDCQTDAKDIKLASENLLEIVNGILDISKIEADKMEIVETEYNPVETFENVAKLVKPRLEDKPIELYTKFAPDIPFMLHGDGGKIRQIITNILTNAAKYTEKGSINFNVDCVNENNISTLVISIEDTGRGIKKDQIDKLFNKFERLEEDRNTTLEGTGLGLAITKRFVEMMGGKIVVHSNYGEGSKFTVYIRQKIVLADKPAHFEDKNESNSINSIDLKDTKVLVVDDNKVNIKVALKILSNYGIVADSCNSGVECIEKIKNGSIYDLILLDDMMPKLTGGETLVELKKINGFNTPVIVLTANAIDGMKDQYLNVGFDDYLSKPIEKDELLRVLITFTKDSKKEKVVETNVALEKEITYTNYSGKKALIVDDNKINIKIASRMIDDYKFDITTCMSGDECLLLCKENTYDIIFMDYMMPDMDGIETLTNLKKDPNFNTPVICLTADAVDGSREKFLEAGFDEYISKPLDRELLDNAINKFLDKKDQ